MPTLDPDPSGTSRAVPPIGPVRDVLNALDAAHLAAVVGGSALLVALGLTDTAHDWDVVVDADPREVAAALAAAGIRAERRPRQAPFESAALFTIETADATVDVIVGFAIRDAAGSLIEVPARRGEIWRGLPLARPEDWATAYAAMGRQPIAELLRTYLG